MPRRKEDLSGKQRRFIDEYMVDANATKAAMRAGYSAKTAEKSGAALMAHPFIKKGIEEKQRKLSDKLEITAERVLSEIAKLAFSNMLDYVMPQDDGSVVVDLSELTRDQAAAIQDVTVEQFMDEGARSVRRTKFKLSDKHAALNTLARHLGLFVEKHQHSFDPIQSASDEFDAKMAKKFALVAASAV